MNNDERKTDDLQTAPWKAAFDPIHAEDALKDHTKEYVSRVIRSRSERHPAVRGLAAAAACLAIMFLAGGAGLFLTPTAFISIDINPSLELGINRFDRVISVEGYNQDGEELAEALDIRFMDYNSALEQLLSDQTVEDYLSQDAVMSVTVASDDEALSSEIMQHVEDCTAGHNNISCHAGDTSEMHDAHEAGLSFGKYHAYLILKELDSSVTPDDVKDLSMRQLYDLIESYTDGAGSGTSDGSADGSTDSSTDGQKGHGQKNSHNNGCGSQSSRRR